MKSQKGFTLIELMVVISILGILAALAIPKFSDATAAAKDAKLKADLRTVDGAIMQYYATNNAFPTDGGYVTELSGAGKLLASWPTDAATGAAFVYARHANAAGQVDGYNLHGVSISNAGATTTRYSPASISYVAW